MPRVIETTVVEFTVDRAPSFEEAVGLLIWEHMPQIGLLKTLVLKIPDLGSESHGSSLWLFLYPAVSIRSLGRGQRQPLVLLGEGCPIKLFVPGCRSLRFRIELRRKRLKDNVVTEKRELGFVIFDRSDNHSGSASWCCSLILY